MIVLKRAYDPVSRTDGSHDTEHNSAVVLRDYLQQKLG